MDVTLRRHTIPSKLLTVLSRALLGLVIGAWVLVGAAWAALQFWIVPRIDEWRPMLEQYASEALGLPVRVQALRTFSDGLFPGLELTQVRVDDAQGRPALLLPRVQASLSLRSLWRLGFDQLLIEQPALDVRRDTQGRIFVAGLELFRKQDNDGRALDWVLSQREWRITGGRVQWHDELRAAPPVTLEQVEVRVRNGRLRHELRIDATPPAELSGRFSVLGQFRQPLLFSRPGEWERWTGQAYVGFERVDLDRLREHVDVPVDMRGGVGAVRAWIDIDQARVQEVATDVVLSHVAVRLAPQLPMLDLARLSGRVGGRWPERGWEVYTQGLQFDTQDGLHWDGGDARVSLQTEPQAGDATGTLSASGVDLAKLATVAQYLPLDQGAHETLALYAPKGRVEKLDLRWQGPAQHITRYSARGQLSQLEVAARPHLDPRASEDAPPTRWGSPGVQGLDVDFDLSQDGGRASVSVRKGFLEVPGLLAQPRIALDQLRAELLWKLQGESMQIQVNNARFANADAQQGELQLKWQTGTGGDRLPGSIDLQGTFARAELAAVHRYLPPDIPAEVRDYLRLAMTEGWASGVRFRVRGNLNDFPFDKPGQGDLRLSATVHDARFAYAPTSLMPAGQLPWPALQNVHGDFVLDRNSLELRNATAQVAGAPQLRVEQGRVNIPDLMQHVNVYCDMVISGGLDDLLRGLVVQSPVDAMLSGVLTQARATGQADARLQLSLPLDDLEKTTVRGKVRLLGNEVQLASGLPRLTRARGMVHFTEQGFALEHAQARALGGEVRAEGGTIHLPEVPTQGAPRLRVNGTVTAQGLRQETQLGPLTAMAQSMSGSTNYQVEMALRDGVPEILATSSLQGLALNLPAPLSKTADASLPLRLQTAVAPGGEANSRRDLLRFDLGRLLAMRYVREHAKDSTRVLRGIIGVGQYASDSLTLPEAGTVGQAQFDTLDLDAWRQLLAVPAGSSAPAANTNASALWRDYLPTQFTVVGNTLLAGGQTVHQMSAGGSREGATWRVNLDAKEVGGYLEYRMPVGTDAGHFYARLAKVVLAQDNAKGVERILDEQPVSMPALDVVINSFELRGMNLGRLEVEAVNRGLSRRDGGAREWRLNKLNLSMPEAEFHASGDWTVFQEVSEPTGRLSAPAPKTSPSGSFGPRTERRRTAMNFQLDINDAGALLQRLGMAGVVRSGKGRMEGQVSWMGSPLSLDYPTLSGAFNLNVETGQFLKAEPGIARLLGVLSLQALPRRLSLDFRDVFTEGFAFDFVRGDVQIDQGVARTNNLQMKGVNAAVLLDGQSDIQKETQDVRVVVVPELNAVTFSLIATWINPAVGLTTFLAQSLLRGQTTAAVTQQFRVTGTWSEPQVTKVDGAAPAAPSVQESSTTPANSSQ
jgi:uncharacterized protein (TIGR02099 family)